MSASSRLKRSNRTPSATWEAGTLQTVPLGWEQTTLGTSAGVLWLGSLPFWLETTPRCRGAYFSGRFPLATTSKRSNSAANNGGGNQPGVLHHVSVTPG